MSRVKNPFADIEILGPSKKKEIRLIEHRCDNRPALPLLRMLPCRRFLGYYCYSLHGNTVQLKARGYSYQGVLLVLGGGFFFLGLFIAGLGLLVDSNTLGYSGCALLIPGVIISRVLYYQWISHKFNQDDYGMRRLKFRHHHDVVIYVDCIAVIKIDGSRLHIYLDHDQTNPTFSLLYASANKAKGTFSWIKKRREFKGSAESEEE